MAEETKIVKGYAVTTKCNGCGTCVDVCPQGCIITRRTPVYIDQERCIKCGSCASVCFSEAIVKIG